MPDHIIIDDDTYVYECLNCEFRSEPPWINPPPDISQDAKDHFIAEYKDCPYPTFGVKIGKNLNDLP